MKQKNTRYIVLLTLLTVFSVGSSRAQLNALIKVGFAGSTLTGKSDSDFSAITRFAGGAGLSYEISNNLLLQPEFLYVIKGASATGSVVVDNVDNPIPIDATFELTYLEVPILLVYRFERQGLRPRIFAGPTLSFKLDAQVTFSAVSGGPEFQERDDTIESSDFGITAGFGFDTDFNDELVTVGLRGTLGLSNARTGDPALHNTSFALYAGIVF